MIPRFDGRYRFLSNFAPSPIALNGNIAPTVEHGFQAAKAISEQAARRILAADSPAEAKRMGRELKHCREDWDQVRLGFMLSLLAEKFGQNPDLRQRLIATHDEELVEGNNWGDTYWGVCDGVGTNWLGRLLMVTRSLIVLEDSK